MKKIGILIIILVLLTITYAAEVKWTAVSELTAINDADILLVVDDVAGSPTSKKITVLNFFDTINTFAKLDTIVTDKTLINEEDAITLDALLTTSAGINLGTSQSIIGTTAVTLGNNAQTWAINSSDWDISVTGIMTGIGNITSDGTIQGNSLTDGTATLTGGALTGLTTPLTAAQGGSGAATFTDGAVLLGSGAGAFTPLAVVTDGLIIIGDGAGDPTTLDVGSSTAITILGTIATGVWDAGAITSSGLLTGTGLTVGAAVLIEAELETLDGITPGTAAASKAVVLDASSNVTGINSLTSTTLVGALTGNADTVTTNANLTGEVTSTGNATVIIESFLEDGGASEIAVTAGMMNTGTNASASTFWRGDNTWVTPSGSGDMTKAVYDVSNDGFVDGNDVVYGALWNADVNAPSMNAVFDKIETLEPALTDKASLESTISDVADFAEADGDVYTNNHDFGGADLEIPQASPAVPNADGEIEMDFTDGTLVIQHGSAHAELASATDVVIGKLIRSFNGTFGFPDAMQSEIDNWLFRRIDATEFPHGIVITLITLTVASNTSYTINVENWDDNDTINGANGTIDSVAYSADGTGEKTESTITYSTIAAGQIIQIDLPTTDVSWISVHIEYYEPAA